MALNIPEISDDGGHYMMDLSGITMPSLGVFGVTSGYKRRD